ncbi:hypothetical protein NAL32_21460 [Chryseobacterium sp. Ch-15]|nr:hypothetical protein [Chryseobacterium muglaense]MCM2556961.1 hypothetical protein [Chryseobacterium muglaense]
MTQLLFVDGIQLINGIHNNMKKQFNGNE